MNQDIITDEKILYKNGSSPLQVRDGVEFVHLPEIGDFLKENYFDKLKSEINQKNSNNEIEKLINEDGFVKEPIVKVGKNIWLRKLTDKRLFDKGYGWICYIKLFHNKPFIVGKTGTSAVHDSMVDFDFIIGDSDDLARNGLGRQFLREKYPNENYMDYDYVLCKNFLTEHDCL